MKKNALSRITSMALLMTATWAVRADASGAHADHEPRHGGILMMNGDLHYEVVVDFKGAFAIYFSDAFRRPLAEGAVKDASIIVMRGDQEGERISLRPNEDGSWAGAGDRIDAAEVTVRVSYSMDASPKPYSIDMSFARSPAIGHGHHRHH